MVSSVLAVIGSVPPPDCKTQRWTNESYKHIPLTRQQTAMLESNLCISTTIPELSIWSCNMIRCLQQKNFNAISEGRPLYFVRDSLHLLKNWEYNKKTLKYRKCIEEEGKRKQPTQGHIAMKNKGLLGRVPAPRNFWSCGHHLVQKFMDLELLADWGNLISYKL